MTYLGLFLRVCSIRNLAQLVWWVRNDQRDEQGASRSRLYSFLIELEERIIDASVKGILSESDSSLQLVTTQSYISKRPRFMKERKERCERFMIWYSTNSVPILRRGDKSQRYLPEALEDYYDYHFVWDEYQAHELKSQGIWKTEVKGSMIFVSQSRKEDHYSLNQRSVVIFDVTPYCPSIGYYSREICEGNLRMMISACEEASTHLDYRIPVLLKPKRRYSNRSDSDYKTYVENLSKAGIIEMLEPSANLYQVIEMSAAVISVPFTSPSIMAKEMNVPSVFAAIDSDEWMIPKEHHGLPVLRSQHTLATWLINQMKG